MSQVEKEKRPNFWRSLAELDGSPEFQEFVHREFAAPLENEPPNSPERRRFIQLMGASFALAGVASGCRWEQEKILPQTRRPQGQVPSESRFYSSSMELGGAAVGLLVTSYDGRPIKVEGNPKHPSSLGATNPFHQAAILGLYDPDRSTTPMRREGAGSVASSWEDFDAFATAHFDKVRAAQGRGLRILAESTSSPTLRALRARFLTSYPEARWVEWEPINRDNERAGSRLALGGVYRTQLRLEKANVILCLDGDVLVQHPGGPGNARRLSTRRSPESGAMNRVYSVESSFSPTGVLADHRLAIRSEQIITLLCAIDSRISAKAQPLPELGAAQPWPDAALLQDPKVAKFVEVVCQDLLANVGSGLVMAGPQQPPEVHALVHRINKILGNVGSTVWYTADIDPDRPSAISELRTLTQEMRAGKVSTLVILGGNPVYSAPPDLDIASGIAAVATSVHLGLYADETAEQSAWHVPQAHWLESWGDSLAWDGTVSLSQPLIAPLYGGRSSIELLARWVGEESSALELVKRTHQAKTIDPRAWTRAVHDGSIAGSALPPVNTTLQSLPKVALSDSSRAGATLANGQLELTFASDAKVYDGRFANNGWLQELPDPYTKLTWDNAALFAPSTAESLGIEDGSRVVLRVGGAELNVLALHAPGQALGSVRVTLGYGRTAAGVVAGSVRGGIDSVGTNTYQIRPSATPWIAPGLSVTATGVPHAVATTQHLHAIDTVGKHGEAERVGEIVREGTLKEWQETPDFPKHAVHHPPLLSLWQDPVAYDGRKWGMTIDLNKCIGCNACMVACQSENNVPVVGKPAVLKGREMHWLRVDRYYRGEADDPEITFQPLPCQQCENAPCEQVCPVGATMHSSEGLNDMVYNRCIGTRYCSNNCPYKVRRFNYFNFNLGYTDSKNDVQRLALNPEVTVRARGVMEKCTFCVQRIQNVKIKAKNGRRSVGDGEAKTACQQACPTEAIVFGDLNDKTSQVAAAHGVARAYQLLGELNNRPRVSYLARVRNRHPDLDVPSPGEDEKSFAAGHGPKVHGEGHRHTSQEAHSEKSPDGEHH